MHEPNVGASREAAANGDDDGCVASLRNACKKKCANPFS